MKRLKPIFLLAVLCLAQLVMTTPKQALGYGGSGDGSEDHPYQIHSCSEFSEIGDDLSAHYELTTSLDCQSSQNDIIIRGNFSGVLDGNGNTITISLEEDSFYFGGIFSTIDGGTVENLTIDGTVNVQNGGNLNALGTLAGRAINGSTLSHIAVTTDMRAGAPWTNGGVVGLLADSTAEYVDYSGTLIGNDGSVGGLFGESICSAINHSSSAGTISNSNGYVGGISAVDGCEGAGSTMQNVRFEGRISNAGETGTGGIVGLAETSNLTQAFNYGMIDGVSHVGGIIGVASLSTTLSRSASINSSVSGSGGEVGGLVGVLTSNSAVSESYATSDVSHTDSIGGGLVGTLNGSASISNSFARGSITGVTAGGLVGQAIAGSIVNSYATGAPSASISRGGLVAETTDGTASNSFWTPETSNTTELESVLGSPKSIADLKNSGILSAASWDFEATWSIDSGANDGFPHLLNAVDHHDGYEGLCEQGQHSATAARVSCQLQTVGSPTGAGNTTWRGRYKKASDSDWTYISLQDSAIGLMLVNNLTPNTDYDLELKASNNLFNRWLKIEVHTNESGDTDQDGLNDNAEDNFGVTGDANGDGWLDSNQTNVSSFENVVTGNYVAIEVDDNCSFVRSAANPESANRKQDPAYSYVTGLLDFTTNCGQNGYTTTVHIYFYGVTQSNLILRKYNPQTGAYTTVQDTSYSQVTIGNQVATVASYSITDGGELDQDGQANGTIVDPVGLGLQTVSAPNTGLGGMR